MATVKDLMMEVQHLRAENKTMLKQITYLEKLLEELLKQDTSLKF